MTEIALVACARDFSYAPIWPEIYPISVGIIMESDLNDLRVSLDNIDNALIFLVAERFRVTQKVGIYKREHRLPTVDKTREKS